MEAIKINRNSWHFKIVKMTNDFPEDICEYRRSFLSSCFLLAFVGCLSGVGLWVMSNMVIGFIFALLYGAWILNDVAIIGSIAILSFGVIFGAPVLWTYIKRLRVDKGKKQPGPVTLAYRSWKEKHCVKVEIVA